MTCPDCKGFGWGRRAGQCPRCGGSGTVPDPPQQDTKARRFEDGSVRAYPVDPDGRTKR